MSNNPTTVRRRSRGPRLAYFLLGLAVLPLIGVAFIGADQYGDSRETRALASEVESSTHELLELEAVRLALANERNWIIAQVGISELGVPETFVEDLAGFAPTERLVDARAQTDTVVSSGLGTDYAAAVAQLREGADEGQASTERTYLDVENEIAERASTISAALIANAGRVPAGAEVSTAIRLQNAAASARYSYSGLQWAYFGSEFASFGTDLAVSASTGDPRNDLVRLSERIASSLDEIDRQAQPGSDIEAALDGISDSRPYQIFTAAVERALERGEGDGAGTGTDIFAAAEEHREVFSSSDASLADFDELVTATTTRTRVAAMELGNDAERQLRRTVATLLVVSVIAIAIAIAITRYVGAPMVQLAAAAQRLGEGAEVRIGRSGPAEVRRVADALQAAADGLAHVERLEHEATHDDLTGVPTRKPIQAELDRALARRRGGGRGGAVMFVDIDHFKDINDTYGHAAGDAVLVTVADRLRAIVRPGDMVGRFGGDEFVVIAGPMESAREAHGLATRVVEVVGTPIDLSTVTDAYSQGAITATVSVGVAMFGDEHEDGVDVLRRADRATYEAKASGRDRAVLATSTPATDSDVRASPPQPAVVR